MKLLVRIAVWRVSCSCRTTQRNGWWGWVSSWRFVGSLCCSRYFTWACAFPTTGSSSPKCAKSCSTRMQGHLWLSPVVVEGLLRHQRNGCSSIVFHRYHLFIYGHFHLQRFVNFSGSNLIRGVSPLVLQLLLLDHSYCCWRLLSTWSVSCSWLVWKLTPCFQFFRLGSWPWPVRLLTQKGLIHWDLKPSNVFFSEEYIGWTISCWSLVIDS